MQESDRTDRPCLEPEGNCDGTGASGQQTLALSPSAFLHFHPPSSPPLDSLLHVTALGTSPSDSTFCTQHMSKFSRRPSAGNDLGYSLDKLDAASSSSGDNGAGSASVTRPSSIHKQGLYEQDQFDAGFGAQQQQEEVQPDLDYRQGPSLHDDSDLSNDTHGEVGKGLQRNLQARHLTMISLGKKKNKNKALLLLRLRCSLYLISTPARTNEPWPIWFGSTRETLLFFFTLCFALCDRRSIFFFLPSF